MNRERQQGQKEQLRLSVPDRRVLQKKIFRSYAGGPEIRGNDPRELRK